MFFFLQARWKSIIDKAMQIDKLNRESIEGTI